jgi:hypothetical protein
MDTIEYRWPQDIGARLLCHFRELAPGSHFQAARWYSALETRAAAPTLSFEKRGIPAKQEGF